MLIQYGIAGIVILLLYKLISNDLKEVSTKLEQLTIEIERLRDAIEKLLAKLG